MADHRGALLSVVGVVLLALGVGGLIEATRSDAISKVCVEMVDAAALLLTCIGPAPTMLYVASLAAALVGPILVWQGGRMTALTSSAHNDEADARAVARSACAADTSQTDALPAHR